jgi:hypothetical protein
VVTNLPGLEGNWAVVEDYTITPFFPAMSLEGGKLPQKQYGLKIDKMFNFKTVKDEKKHIQSCSDCRHSQRI